MEAIEKLLAIEEIKQCKARYWRAADSKDFELLRSVFTDDAIFDKAELLRDPVKGQHPDIPVQQPSVGLKTIMENARKSMHADVQSVHMGHIPEIHFHTDSRAEAIFPFEDLVIDHRAGIEFNGYGCYRDEFVKIEGQWRIHRSKAFRYRLIFKSSAQ